MIECVSIANVATFHPTTPELLDDLRKLNYIFGSNGTGKTTISRVIADPADNSSCRCTWKDGRQLETIVLNTDFVKKNFGQLRGVFTLGQASTDTENKINAAKEEETKECSKLRNLRTNLHGDNGSGGKSGELEQLEADCRDKFWVPVEKLKRDGKLVDALRGVLNDKEACKRKILEESEKNTAILRGLADLEKRAETVFGETPTKQATLRRIDGSALTAHESNPILKKKVIGKEDVDIAAMISRLGNSDWVRQGLPYYEVNSPVCPFCQQETRDEFSQSLKDYFDETFESDTDAITTLISQYAEDTSAVQSVIDGILSAPGKYLDLEMMKAEKAALDQTVEANKLRLVNKKKEPSQVVALKSVDSVLAKIKDLVDPANAKVAQHNEMVDNLATEKKTLTDQVWRLVINELGVDLNQYQEKRKTLAMAIAGIKRGIIATEARITAKTDEIRELEQQTTSIQPTINAINRTLQTFGFDSFSLADAGDGKHYKLIRANGDDARETLSEGEQGFVVFLYFYHLLKGSFSETGMTTDRVVVFDDPVSSLDSDVLFIVSSLIREVCESARAGIGHIKQVLVLTHNVYFYKEITFDKRRKENRPNDESFWIARKVNSLSRLTWYDENPIKTSYELLWMEVREAQEALQNGGSVNAGIGNTLRRILEHYFTILGSTDLNDICNKFDGPDKCICKSLFSWVHAGSHSPFDDAHIAPSDATTTFYLRVFKDVFYKSNHIAHYKMMMGDQALAAS